MRRSLLGRRGQFSLLPLVPALLLITCISYSLTHFTFSGDSTCRRCGSLAKFGPVLVVYVFSGNDRAHIENLRYFVREGVGPDDGADYFFIIQLDEDGKKPSGLPELPKKAQYVYHKNECFDWGTFGWFLKREVVRLSKYKYFIFMNGSTRGPFLPAYEKEDVHWAEPFLSRINDVVKLVGPTVNCGGFWPDKNKTKFRENPHVQSYLFATDQVGLQVMLDDGNVFACHNAMEPVIYYSELGSSAAILQAGYSLDSLMLRYQGVDWQNKGNWKCNSVTNPCAGQNYDGAFLNPLEVMFVKVKDAGHGGDSEDSALLARKYSQWTMEVEDDVRWIATNRNEPPEHLPPPAQCNKELHEMGCFDTQYYSKKNGDLPEEWADPELFAHFVSSGKGEGRNHRFSCSSKPV